MYMNAPETYIRILDFEEQVGILLHDNRGYFFFFPNQTMKPESWQHVCLSMWLWRWSPSGGWHGGLPLVLHSC